MVSGYLTVGSDWLRWLNPSNNIIGACMLTW